LKKIFVLFLIFALSTSAVNANSLNFANGQIIEDVSPIQSPKESSKHITINLHDGLLFSENEVPQNVFEIPTTVNYKIELSEVININVDDKKFEEFIYSQFPFNNFAILERINEKDKPKSKRNSLTLESLSSSNVNHVSDNSILENLEFNFAISNIDHVNIQEIFLENNFIQTIFTEQNISESEESETSKLILLAFVPLVGYVFLRTEVQRFPIVRSKQIFTSFFVVLLVSSLFSVPYSISDNYWSMAYAEEMTDATDPSVKITIESKTESEEPDLEKILAEITAEMEAKKLAESQNATTVANTTSTEPVTITNTTSTEPVTITNTTSTEPVTLS